MRLLLVGISGLALTACSMNGYEYGHAQGPSYGVHPGHSACQLDPCQAGHQPPLQQPYGAQYGHGQYVSGHVAPPPVTQWAPPAPQAPCSVQHYQPAPILQAAPSPCAAGVYSVAPQTGAANFGSAEYGGGFYGHNAPTVHTPAAHAYGHPANAYGPSQGYGLRGALGPRQPYKYGTLGATWYDIDQPYAGIQGRLGYQSSSVLGAEFEGSIGVISETSPFDQPNPPGANLVGESKDGVDYQIAGFGVARLPISQNISVHGRAGYHQTKIYSDTTVNGVDFNASTKEDGFAYGAGAELNITPVDALRADYTRYDLDGGALDSVSLAYLRRF